MKIRLSSISRSCAMLCFLLVCGGWNLHADNATPAATTVPDPGELLKTVQQAIDDLGKKTDAYGVYAIYEDRLLRLPSYGNSYAPSPEDLKSSFLLSSRPSFIVYGKWLTKNKPDASTINGFDWRLIDVKPRPKFLFTIQAIPDHPDMVMITPQDELKPSLYSVQAGNLETGLPQLVTGEFRFAVQTPDEEVFWRQMEREHPDSWHAQSHLGAFFWARHDIDGALAHWKRATELGPKIYETHNNYALALNAKGQADEALEQYKQAVAVGGTYVVRLNYAQALQTAKHYDEAIKQFDAVQKLAPGNAMALAAQGVCYSEVKEWDVAVKCFKMALAINPDDAGTKANLEIAQKKSDAGVQSVEDAWEGK